MERELKFAKKNYKSMLVKIADLGCNERLKIAAVLRKQSEEHEKVIENLKKKHATEQTNNAQLIKELKQVVKKYKEGAICCKPEENFEKIQQINT